MMVVSKADDAGRRRSEMSGTDPIASVVRMFFIRAALVGAETSKCVPKTSQMTAFDGRMTVATAASDSARGRDDLRRTPPQSASVHFRRTHPFVKLAKISLGRGVMVGEHFAPLARIRT